MSEIYYEFTFFKTHPQAFIKLTKSVSNELSPSELLQALDLTVHLDEEREHLESFHLYDSQLKLSFCNSTSSRFNHALVRAFKDYGCEFCHVDAHNSQVGESDDFYLHRGKEVSGKESQDLLDQFNPDHRIGHYLQPGNSGLSEALQQGLDPNSTFEGDPLLLVAFNEENKPAFDTLLKAGADANVVTTHGERLVFEIVNSVTLDTHGFLAALVENGADIDKTDSEGHSFLWSLGRADLALRQKLLAQGKQLIRPDDAYENDDPLENFYAALAHHDVDKWELLYAECSRDGARQHELAMLFARYDNSDGFTKLLDSGFNPFPEAAPNQDNDVAGVDDDDGSTFEILEEAVTENSKSIISTLLTIAEQEGLDYSSQADSFACFLAPNPKVSDALKAIIKKYPAAADYPALSQAVEANCLENARLLLDAGAPLSEEDEEPLLHSHLHTLTPQMFSFLVERGCDPFETGYYEDTEDSSTIERAQSETEVREDTRDAFVAWLDSSDKSEVIYQYANLDMHDKFMARWQTMSADERKEVEIDTLMYSAAINNNASITKFCLDQGFDANHKHESGASLLELATVTSGHSVINVLLKKGADPNTLFDLEAISAASAAFNEDDGSEEDEGDDYEDEDDDDEATNALLNALGMSDEDTPEYVKQADKTVNETVNVSSKYASCLMFAASTGDERSVALLLAAKADANLSEQESKNWTALTYAVVNGHTHCVAMLLDAGAKVDAIDESGNTLVHYAALRGHSKILEKLLKANAPAEELAGDESQTPLILAAITALVRDDDTTIDQLLSHGVDVNTVDNSKSSALTYACKIAKEPLIATLLKNGANVNQVSESGNTPYDEFIAHDITPSSFELDQLKPTSKSVKVKKGMKLVKTIISQIVVATVLLLLFGAIFSITIGLIAAALYLSWPLLRWCFIKLLSKVSDKLEDDEESHEEDDDSPANGSAFLQVGMNALLKAQAEAEKLQDKDEEIIDSWDDEEKAA